MPTFIPTTRIQTTRSYATPLCPPDRSKLLDAIRTALLDHRIILVRGYRYTYLKPSHKQPHYRIVSPHSPDGVYVELSTCSRWQWLATLDAFLPLISTQIDSLSDFDKICLWFTVRQAQDATAKKPLLLFTPLK